jgi:hypothetical protein
VDSRHVVRLQPHLLRFLLVIQMCEQSPWLLPSKFASTLALDVMSFILNHVCILPCSISNQRHSTYSVSIRSILLPLDVVGLPACSPVPAEQLLQTQTCHFPLLVMLSLGPELHLLDRLPIMRQPPAHWRQKHHHPTNRSTASSPAIVFTSPTAHPTHPAAPREVAIEQDPVRRGYYFTHELFQQQTVRGPQSSVQTQAGHSDSGGQIHGYSMHVTSGELFDEGNEESTPYQHRSADEEHQVERRRYYDVVVTNLRESGMA